MNYTVSKNVPHLTCYNLDTHDPIMIIYGRSVTEKVKKQMMCVVFPPRLSSASVLPCKTGTQKTAHWCIIVRTIVQLLQLSRLPFSWTMPSKSPKLHALITRFRDLYSSECQSWVKKTEEIKQRLVEFSQWTNTASEKNAIFVFSLFDR